MTQSIDGAHQFQEGDRVRLLLPERNERGAVLMPAGAVGTVRSVLRELDFTHREGDDFDLTPDMRIRPYTVDFPNHQGCAARSVDCFDYEIERADHA